MQLPVAQINLQISSVFDVSCDYLLKDDVEQENHSRTVETVPVRADKRERISRIMMLVGGLGILAFWILSAVYPAGTHFAVVGQAGETVKTGLAGFLDYHDMGLLFALCCLTLAAGIAVYMYPYIKQRADKY